MFGGYYHLRNAINDAARKHTALRKAYETLKEIDPSSQLLEYAVLTYHPERQSPNPSIYPVVFSIQMTEKAPERYRSMMGDVGMLIAGFPGFLESYLNDLNKEIETKSKP